MRISTGLRSNGSPAMIAFTRGARDPPLGDAAIGRKPAVQRAGGGPVLVENVAPHDRAQPLDVEKRVLDFERIEGPLDQLDPARQRVVALRQLQPAAHAGVRDIPAALPACGCADSFSRRPSAPESPGRIRSCARRRTRRAPARRFCVATTNSRSGSRSTSSNPQISAAIAPRREISACEASGRISIIASRLGLLPQRLHLLNARARQAWRAALRNAKRLRNFALVFRSACSGSTLSKRARFTSTKSRSPISPSISACAAVLARVGQLVQLFVQFFEHLPGIFPVEPHRGRFRS